MLQVIKKHFCKKFASLAVRAVSVSQFFTVFTTTTANFDSPKRHFLTKLTIFSRQCKGTQNAQLYILNGSFYYIKQQQKKKTIQKNLHP
jgi:hypothetical protein